MTAAALATSVSWFDIPLTIAVALFAFTTVLSYSYYGMKAVGYLFNDSTKAEFVFKIIFVIFTVIGAARSLGPENWRARSSASGLPVTLIRVTQFHDFVDTLLESARKGPVLPVPMGWRVQPVDVGEVAGQITELVTAPPAGGVREYGGPEELTAAELARTWVAARAPGTHVVSTPVPGKLSAAIRDGAAVPDGGARGRRSYAEHLRG